MIFSKFSPKQLDSMLWWSKYGNKYDAIVCDGAVRSGKTMSMAIGFVLWSCHTFNGENFAFCGKTIDSLKRNVIQPLQKWLEGVCKLSVNLSRNFLEITMEGHTNRYYLFGGKDESSYQLIQGITLAGVFLDEVALMPRSFVEQALARCSVTGAKFWFNCNPESPYHWFYIEWVDDASEKVQDKRRLHLHFTMDDNLSLSKETKERYDRMYSGVFRDRYILGLWVFAEGVIYTDFHPRKHVVEMFEPQNTDRYYVAIDYGIMNPTAMQLWCLRQDDSALLVRESYYDARQKGVSRTDEEHYRELERFTGDLADQIEAVIVDPSAASFIECIFRHHRFRVMKANNNVLDGIRDTATLLEQGYLLFHSSCKDTIREFGQYRWNDRAGFTDCPIKEHDHAMDAMRYFVKTIMWRTLRVLREEG